MENWIPARRTVRDCTFVKASRLAAMPYFTLSLSKYSTPQDGLALKDGSLDTRRARATFPRTVNSRSWNFGADGRCSYVSTGCRACRATISASSLAIRPRTVNLQKTHARTRMCAYGVRVHVRVAARRNLTCARTMAAFVAFSPESRERPCACNGTAGFLSILRNSLALEMPHSRRFVDVTMATRAHRTFDSARNPTPFDAQREIRPSALKDHARRRTAHYHFVIKTKRAKLRLPRTGSFA